jgi:hypothetical protein
MGARPIRELHVRIEHLEAPPKVRKRRLELPLEGQRRAECHVRPDETGRIVIGKMQRLSLAAMPLFIILRDIAGSYEVRRADRSPRGRRRGHLCPGHDFIGRGGWDIWSTPTPSSG